MNIWFYEITSSRYPPQQVTPRENLKTGTTHTPDAIRLEGGGNRKFQPCSLTFSSYFSTYLLSEVYHQTSQKLHYFSAQVILILMDLFQKQEALLSQRGRAMLRVCMSVVSFVASIVQYLERSCFIISYFSFGFTDAYNSILFCCLRCNVKPCCHTYDQS